jgi:phosphatidylglycerol:prolipoprotein diacylglycerol transferase
VTVYPFVIHFGRFSITGYGIMMMFAFLGSGWVFARRLKEVGRDENVAWDAVMWAVIGGLAGAKVYYALLMHDWGSLLSRAGLVWYGGFIGGVLAVMAYLWWKRIAIAPTVDAVAPALAAGYAIGRVGCFLVGDDYGRPSTLPWAMAFPQGSPPTTAQVLQREFGVALPAGTPPQQVLAVHPTQLYEVALAFCIFAVLWRLRAQPRGAGWLFGAYLVMMGLERAFVEIFRAKDDRFFGPVTLAQLFSLGVVLVGALILARTRRQAAAGAA